MNISKYTNILVIGNSLSDAIAAFSAADEGKNVLIIDFKNDFAGDKIFKKLAALESKHVSIGGLPFNPLIPFVEENPDTNERHELVGSGGFTLSGVITSLLLYHDHSDNVEIYSLVPNPFQSSIPFTYKAQVHHCRRTMNGTRNLQYTFFSCSSGGCVFHLR